MKTKYLQPMIKKVKEMAGPRLTFKQLKTTLEGSPEREELLFICFCTLAPTIHAPRKEWPELRRLFFENYLDEICQKPWYPEKEKIKKKLFINNNDLLAKHMAGMVRDRIFVMEKEEDTAGTPPNTLTVEVLTERLILSITSETLVRKVNDWCNTK